MTLTRLFPTLLLLALPVSAQIGVFGQSAQRPGLPANSGLKPGTVEGIVKNAVTGAPVKKAMVRLQGGRGAQFVAAADGAGHFLFDHVDPGSYMAVADHEGYTFAQPFLRGANSYHPITVAEDEHVKGVEITLIPMGAINGKVVNEDREPMVRVQVQAMQYDYSQSGKRLVARGGAVTDDRGEYRIFDLEPGRYYLMATSPTNFATPAGPRVHSDIADEGYQPAYFPDGTDPSQAAPIDVKPGADLTGEDFRLHKISIYHIRGKAVDGQTKQPIRGLIQVGRCGNDSYSFNGGPGVTMMRDGTFDARGVAPGSYCLIARENAQGSTGFASVPVTVETHDVDGVVLETNAGFDLPGTVIVEGTPPARLQSFHIMLRGVDQTIGVPNGSTKSDGSFVLQNVFPATYNIMMQGLPPTLYLKSVRFGSQDASDGVLRVAGAGSPLTLVIGTDPGQVTGTVESSDGQPVQAMVIAAPPDGPLAARGDLVKLAGSSPTGQVTLQGLAPGDYKVFALDQFDASLSQNAELRKLLESQAASVSVRPGETASVQLRSISAADLEQAKGKLK